MTAYSTAWLRVGVYRCPPDSALWHETNDNIGDRPHVVFPALTLNYLGQGSLILESPKAIDNPFFLLMPHWSRIPVVLLATLATVIASQAVISGAFSVTRQAVRLGFLPRLNIRHTSHEEGQVYVPAVNWLLCCAVAVLVVAFGSSAKLAAAYGLAVAGTMATTTIVFVLLARFGWLAPLWVVVPGAAILLLAVSPWFLFMSASFMTHNLSLALALSGFLAIDQQRRRTGPMWSVVAGLCLDVVAVVVAVQPVGPRCPVHAA